METMFFADEVRDINDVAAIPKNTRVGGRELAMAGHLIDGLTRPWNPSTFTDSYRDRVMKIVAKKSKGQEIQPVAEGEEPAEVIDLMAALRATLEGNKGVARRPARAAHERKTGGGRHRTKRRSTRAPTAISR
jgi:DNA end-binding protein Ku